VIIGKVGRFLTDDDIAEIDIPDHQIPEEEKDYTGKFYMSVPLFERGEYYLLREDPLDIYERAKQLILRYSKDVEDSENWT
jgi:hypothetical protein